ncbi:MAG: hypothetical protein Q9221_001957 [Calogaya cf. arnoldii]
MTTNAAKGAAKQLQSGRTANAYLKKYTVRTTGIWDRIRRALAIDPNRSSGVPLNPQYRNPPPGANPPGAYDDPVTVPAGDIAENAYFRRDVRRSYPRLSVVKQGDVVGLLTVGSIAKPKDDVLQLGDAGAKQLIQVQAEGEERGLAALFKQEKTSMTSILGPDGMPPFPTGGSRTSPEGGRKYVMDADRVEGYPEEYPCRTFSRPETIDFILSCSICQNTLSTIYGQDGNSDGLHQGTDNTGGAINKLWLTECAHITCAQHLEGGGVPFHPKEQPPKAPCPLCVRNHQDYTAKILYAIRGTAKGEYDNDIPAEYFEVPPQQLGNSGNEALRFQYVSLVRFASGLYETLGVTQRELYTWKDRESSIVACLAAMEPLSRALQSARDQLVQLRGDVSLIDNALQLAANLRVNAALPKDPPQMTSTNEMQANTNPPAGSLLARGSAVDLQSIQDGVKLQDSRGAPLNPRAGQCTQEPSPKRRRVGTADNLGRQYQQESDLQILQQRRASSDAMPPPSGHPPKTNPLHESVQWSSHHSQSPYHYLMGALDADGQLRESTTPLQNSSPTRAEISASYNPRLTPNGNYPNTSRTIWERDNDGELDQALQSSNSRIRTSGHPIPRLTLPPSTPILKYTTPRRRVGISAHARTSQPPFLTPESSSSLQGRMGQYNPGHNSNQTVASPHFSTKTLPSLHASQRPYTNGMALSTVPKTITSTPKPNDHASRSFSWLPALRGHVEHQNQHKTKADELESRSGAYRRPGGSQPTIHQPPSLNSFSFMNKPHIGSDALGCGSGAASVNHRRRAVRR